MHGGIITTTLHIRKLRLRGGKCKPEVLEGRHFFLLNLSLGRVTNSLVCTHLSGLSTESLTSQKTSMAGLATRIACLMTCDLCSVFVLMLCSCYLEILNSF